MSITALMLFGSAARGDYDESSDLDLLAVAQGDVPKLIRSDFAELQFLGEQTLLEMADRGDLFAIHLAFEGKVIFDIRGFFHKFRERLHVQKNYGHIRRAASDLGWFLVDHGRSFERDLDLVHKRAAWCVRTILISNLVESGRFIFSPSGLLNVYDTPAISRLLKLRRSTAASSRWPSDLQQFLGQFGSERPTSDGAAAYLTLFLSTENRVGIATVTRLSSGQGGTIGYPDSAG